MSSITSEKLKKDFNNQFDMVLSTGKELVISRNRKRAVMLSLKEFNALKETAYLLSTEANRKHLSKSFTQAKKGQMVKIDLSDLA
jgi:antitoxin YefM